MLITLVQPVLMKLWEPGCPDKDPGRLAWVYAFKGGLTRQSARDSDKKFLEYRIESVFLKQGDPTETPVDPIDVFINTTSRGIAGSHDN